MFRARTAQNVAISVGLNWFSQLLQIVTKVVLARLLFPSDFGIFAIASGLISFIGTFGNFGLNYAIIQKGDAATKEDYDVAMSLRLLIAAGLFIASVVVAGPWASLFPQFPQPLVTSVTQVAALAYLIIPWSFVPSTRLTQELRYKAQVIPSLAGQVATAAASIAFAVLGYGVWSFVYGLLLGQLASTVGYSFALPWRFRLSFRRSTAASLVGYAQHLISASVLSFLITNIDNFTVGYLLGPTSLGFYAVAYGLGFIPVSLVSSPTGIALFPSLAKIQDNLASLKSGYVESFGYVVAVILPSSVGLAVTSPELVAIVLGPKWLGATLALAILAMYGLGRALVDFSSSLFQAVGKPRIVAEMNLYILLLSLVPLFPLTLAWGIPGTALAMTIPVLIVGALAVRRAAHVLESRPIELLRKAKGALVASLAMGGVVLLVRYGLYSVLPPRIGLPFVAVTVSAGAAVFLIEVLVGLAGYTLFLRILDPELFKGAWRHLGMVLRPGRGPPQA